MKMPLPGNHSWNVTTEVGGYDCMGPIYGSDLWPDKAHSGDKYFSIDFSWKNNGLNGVPAYTETSNIPVFAPVGGVVKYARGGDSAGNPNGFYVVIDHDYDGNLGTGFATWYAHLKFQPSVTEGSNVVQGQLLGYMGSTGKDSNGNRTSTSTHLHFGVKYGTGVLDVGSGSAIIPELTKVIMEGKLLKSYQTECAVNSNGVPTSRIRYYPSTNQTN
ncbi:MAG: M23 family metallopeptidase [Minisyncoccota bacterium]